MHQDKTIGIGETIEGTKDKLRKVSPEKLKKIQKAIKAKKIFLASDKRIAKYDKPDGLAEEFLYNIWKIKSFLITDDSSIWDFEPFHSKRDVVKRIEKLYSINLKPLKKTGYKLVDVFRLIEKNG